MPQKSTSELSNSSANSVLPHLLHAAITESNSVVRGNLVRAISLLDDPVLFPYLTELLTRLDGTPDAKTLGDEVMAAMRERRTREWPEANK